MSREIMSTTGVAAMPSKAHIPNDFKDRLVKLIPSEIVTAYITLQGLIGNQENKQLFTCIAFGSLLAITPFYLRLISQVKKNGQIIFTTIAFVIWVMAIGGFKVMTPSVTILDQFFGSLILIIYTLLIPFFYKG
jgi:hypothetical protein